MTELNYENVEERVVKSRPKYDWDITDDLIIVLGDGDNDVYEQVSVLGDVEDIVRRLEKQLDKGE